MSQKPWSAQCSERRLSLCRITIKHHLPRRRFCRALCRTVASTARAHRANKDAIQDAYRTWLGARDFKPRRGQREMIAQIARTLGQAETRICVVEAGTGTGKTAAYRLAAIPLASTIGKTVVVSTATVALQEQVVLQDRQT